MADPLAPRLKLLLNNTGSNSQPSRAKSRNQPIVPRHAPKPPSFSKSKQHRRPASLPIQDSARLTPVAEDEYELHEYEWPDLPPMEQIRNALSRGNISQGVRYLLPVDKTRNSVDGKFRTDLRTMFKTEYVNDLNSYDEGKIVNLTRFHFSTNTQPTDKRPKAIQLHPRQEPINHDSHMARLAYCQSAPTHGLVGSKTTVRDLRARSSLNFPLKQKVPEEAKKLKAEAERILKSVQEKDQGEEEYDPNKDSQILNEQGMAGYRRAPEKRKQSMLKQPRVMPSRNFNRARLNLKRSQLHKTDNFGSYDELKNAEVPTKRELPSRFKSSFLSEAKTEKVWDWLNTGEKITDFSYFLEVCS